MVRISRILKDYRDAGAVSSLVNLWGFVGESTFLTKSGALGQVFRVRGIDDECLEHAQRRAVTSRIEQALRQLPDTCRLYQYLIKRQAAAFPIEVHHNPMVDRGLRDRAAYLAAKSSALFEFELYMVILHEGWTAARRMRSTARGRTSPGALRRFFSLADIANDLGREMDRAVAELTQRADAFMAHLTDTVAPVRLPKADAFSFFRQLLNYEEYKLVGVPLKYDTHLDFYVADSTVECHRGHLAIDRYLVKVLTMKDAPSKTCAHFLSDLWLTPSPFIACVEWQREPIQKVRAALRARERHFFNSRIALINYVSRETKPEDMLVDASATSTVQEVGRCRTELEVNGQVLGQCSFTMAFYDRDPRRLEESVAESIKAFAGHDGALYEESYNLLNAWLSLVPGNAEHNVRRLSLLNTNAADLSLLFTRHTGERTSAHFHDRPCLAVFETDAGTPYCWNLHHQDVGHTLIQGASGAGKTFLANFIVLHAQKYDPVTVVFDLGGAYDDLVKRLGGSSWRMGLAHAAFAINPFCLEPTPENLHFLFSFVRVLIQSSGQHQLSMAEDRDLYEAVENVYALDAPNRRLLTVSSLLPRSLAQHLHRWVQGGPYAGIFDNAEDTLTLQRIQCFDFEGLERFPLLLEPLLFYVLHRASAAVQDRAAAAQLKLFVLDEAWRFARDPIVKAYITEALKTWRKRNAALILATQNSEDFLDADLLRTVVESCPTQFFLANPGMDLERARELFHLNAAEAEILHRLRPRQQALLKRPDISKVINLNVPRVSHPAIQEESAL